MTKHRVYVDNNGTTPLRKEVSRIITQTLESCWANPSSRHEYAEKANETIDTSRERICRLINSKSEEITFTSGGTESNNMVIHTVCKLYSKPHIVISAVEHDSVSLYARNLLEDGLITLTEVDLDFFGDLSPEAVLEACTDQTRLVSIMLANNETGVIFNVSKIAGLMKKEYPGILVHTDAAQTIGKIPVNVVTLGVDYLTIVGHKFYGPRIGALYHKESAPLVPLLIGGGQEGGMRPGTENTPMIAGLGMAAKLVTENLTRESNHMLQTRDYLEQRLLDTFAGKLVVNCKDCTRLPNTTNFAIFLENCKSSDVLKRAGFIASKGASCHTDNTSAPSQVLLNSGVSHEVAMNSIRISFGINNTKQDVDFIINDLVRISNECRIV